MKFYKHITIIGVDHGYGNCKTANFVFPSGILHREKELYFTNNLLIYKGEHYIIGTGHKEYIPNKNADDEYYIMTLAAIAMELNQRGTTQAVVHIAAGLPLAWLSQQMNDFRAYLLQNEKVDFIFNGKEYHITISGADIFPQGFSAIASEVASFNGMNMLADIGNGTMNIMTIVNGVPDVQNFYTPKFGTHQCTIQIKELMERKHHATIPESVITEILRTGTADISPEYLETIVQAAKDYVNDIFRILREHNYNPNLMKLYVVGGGGCLIKNFGSYDKDRVIINPNICATAKGYEYLAELILQSGGVK